MLFRSLMNNRKATAYKVASEVFNNDGLKGVKHNRLECMRMLKEAEDEWNRNSTLEAVIQAAATQAKEAQAKEAQAELIEKQQTALIEQKAALIEQQAALIEQQKASNECPICFSPKDHALTPCGHMLCGECVHQVEICPLCRVPIEGFLKVFQ